MVGSRYAQSQKGDVHPYFWNGGLVVEAAWERLEGKENSYMGYGLVRC